MATAKTNPVAFVELLAWICLTASAFARQAGPEPLAYFLLGAAAALAAVVLLHRGSR